MTKQTSLSAKANQGRVHGVIPFALDVLMNRATMSGTITDMEYIEGKFMNTDFEKATA